MCAEQLAQRVQCLLPARTTVRLLIALHAMCSLPLDVCLPVLTMAFVGLMQPLDGYLMF